ncbi:hypothetical protein [Xanthomonas hortorum]|uniref:hypothetical protein n=1 Tax=Xanthomonas hortorum TaxID=56454 RepID=UPI001F17A79C|nr:hypothetical protein [Xanthomonas hortorum]MCE4363514.1 hypothetical protein [Xanthomonas hortorum]
MKLRIFTLAVAIACVPPVLAKGPTPALSNAQIKTALIRESINSYPGNCPCPYNTARNGSSCGGRSAYSRGGGYAPLCYPKDVTAGMVAEYRQGVH